MLGAKPYECYFADTFFVLLIFPRTDVLEKKINQSVDLDDCEVNGTGQLGLVYGVVCK